MKPQAHDTDLTDPFWYAEEEADEQASLAVQELHLHSPRHVRASDDLA
jgi:hypothetical protein